MSMIGRTYEDTATGERTVRPFRGLHRVASFPARTTERQ